MHKTRMKNHKTKIKSSIPKIIKFSLKVAHLCVFVFVFNYRVRVTLLVALLKFKGTCKISYLSENDTLRRIQSKSIF